MDNSNKRECLDHLWKLDRFLFESGNDKSETEQRKIDRKLKAIQKVIDLVNEN